MNIRQQIVAVLAILTWGVCMIAYVPSAGAIGSSQNPQSASLGIEGTIPAPPPTQAATISIPSNGQTFTTMPITVGGLCKTDLLVKVFSNNVFIGSVVCSNGSFSLQVQLFSGRNDLVAQVYDSLDQQGPDSNLVSVTFNDAQYVQFGSHVSITSTYARIGVNPGAPLNWPFIISGGTPPYAVSIDWGDGNGPQLKSVSFPGNVTLSHTYNQSGVYPVTAKVTDTNGTSAYLQVVGVANGKIISSVSSNSGSSSNSVARIVVILWQPLLIAIPLLLVCFWLGRRYELFSIRKSIEESREQT